MKTGNGSRKCWFGCAALAVVVLVSTAWASPRVELRPVNNGLYRPIGAPVIPGAIITGNRIALPAGGVNVELELLASDWGTSTCPNNSNPGPCTLGALQATILGAGATSGYLGANANPPQAGVNLNPLGYPTTLVDGKFVVRSVCSTNLRDCTAGGPNPPCSSGPEGFCVPNVRSLIYCVAHCEPFLTPISLNYEYGGVNGLVQGIPDVPAANAHNRGYFGTLILQVPASAATTYTVGFVDSQDFTFFNDDVGLLIPDPLLNPNQTGPVLIPAQIQVATGSCCVNFGPSPTCIDHLTQAECNAAAGTSSHLFRFGKVCPQDGGSACPLCLSAVDCRDPLPGQTGDDNLCTSQVCTNSGCEYSILYSAQTQCCHPDSGMTSVILDDDPCTADVCHASTGAVAHLPSSGAACDDQLDCTSPDYCSEGVCVGGDVDTDADTVADCDDVCPGHDDILYASNCALALPTVSTWGLLVLALALLCLAKLKYKEFAA